MKFDKKITAVILAAGSGTRMNASGTKQLMKICGESVVHRSVRAFCECAAVDGIVVVCRREETDIVRTDLSDMIGKPIVCVEGGKSRAESARLGFEAAFDADFVAIHDAARCLITSDMIERVIDAAIEYGASTAAAPITDTVKLVRADGCIERTVPRAGLYGAQTPQIFSREIYSRMLDADLSESEITDDNIMAERLGINVRIVDIGAENFKITTMADLDLAEYKIRKNEAMTDFRIGHGYDVHRFVSDRALVLGGVEIPCDRGLLGHSDADVLTHAIMDSLLGAAALGDIGKHFPDSSDEFRGISSILLLRRVRELVCNAGYEVQNIDATLVMQSPKIASYVPSMVANVADALEIDISYVNVKATTEERLGFTGSGEGAAAHAVSMLKRKRG